MKKITGCLLLIVVQQYFLFAQQNTIADSSVTLDKVMITAFEQNRVVNSGTIVKVISNSNADRFNKTSLVNAFNAVAGVRMEERSPGSYRINIRGSSLRSPFGIRNVKVYWNDIPVTDPGGNTYFNQFAFNNFSSIQIFKGPAGSMYGAGTGGLLLMHSFNNTTPAAINVEYITGSYGLQNVLFAAAHNTDDSRSQFTYANSHSDGYRDNSKTQRQNASFVSQLKISDKQELTASVLYNNLVYQTPGGLTKAEFTANPKQARPAAGGFPSAAVAKATIYQKTFLAGINHQYQFTGSFKNSTSLYGSFAQIKNPTFRNYERRNEPGFGGRTTFVYNKNINTTNVSIVGGGELQEGFFNTQVAKNKNGNPDTLQTNDDISYSTYSVFTQADISVQHNWIFTAGASINRSKVNFTRLSSYPVLQQSRTYKNEISPRLALQKILGKTNAVFASVSKGFSPPSVSELLPSTGVISTFLEAEQGINYELGGRVALLKNKLHLEATGFYFRLNNALVTRKDSSNADYYVNAGNTKQKGVEISADYAAFFSHTIIEYVMIRSAFTVNDFKYGHFKKGTTDFSGKYLPSVPGHSIAVIADVQLKNGLYFNSTCYLAGKIYLDDANTVETPAYNLLACRLGYKLTVKQKTKLNFYTGVDNLLNETYSLGNDINAAAGRYYNTAAKRNFYAGVAFAFHKEKTK
jgi:iron complex outermembrane recepter protein